MIHRVLELLQRLITAIFCKILFHIFVSCIHKIWSDENLNC